MKGNDFISWVLRSPLHGVLSNSTMLITVTGCKTGRKYTLPIDYYEGDGFLWIISCRDRTWWRNLEGGAEVKLLLRRKTVTGLADIILDENTVELCMLDYVKHIPQAAKPMGIHVENGKANLGDIARTAKDRLFVRVKLSN